MAFCEYHLGDAIAARNYLEQGRPYTKIPEETATLEQLSQTLGPPVVEGLLRNIECQGKASTLQVRIGEIVRTFLVPGPLDAASLACGPQNDIAVRIEFQAMPVGATGADGIVRSLTLK
jgi:hypothetical protein